MSLIIDGHNLIGVLPDIHLHQSDDEARLLARLRAYRAHSGGRSLIVFFDSGPSAAPFGRSETSSSVQMPIQSSPGVQVRYAAPGQTADDAIIEYLHERVQPGQFAVVTNDQGLAWRARDAGASVLSANDFAAKLASVRRAASAPVEPPQRPDDPAFADIYATFIEAEKRATRFRGEKRVDVATWIERLDRGDPQLAAKAARWLGVYGGQAAVEPLRVALLHDDAGVRAAALLALADLGERAVLPDLCDRLSNDSNSMVREAAAQSLGRIGDRSVEGALALAVESDHKGKVRKAARAALEQIRARGLRGR
jgi:hypothetical protein